LRKSSGSLAIFAAIRRASSRVSNFAADGADRVRSAHRFFLKPENLSLRLAKLVAQLERKAARRRRNRDRE